MQYLYVVKSRNDNTWLVIPSTARTAGEFWRFDTFEQVIQKVVELNLLVRIRARSLACLTEK